MKNNVRKMVAKNWIHLVVIVLIMIALLLSGACAKKKIRSDFPSIQRSGDQPTAGGSEGTGQGMGQGTQDGSKVFEKGLDDTAAAGAGADETGAARTARERFENDDVFFEFDSAALLPEAQSLLMEKSEWLRNHPGVNVVIEGHTDERGTIAYNLALGDRRAESVRAFLMELGVDTSRIRTVSYGEENPIDPDQTESAWAKNRRAHFYIEK